MTWKSSSIPRRTFITATTFGVLGVSSGLSGCSEERSQPGGRAGAHRSDRRVAFNTANLVARFTDYRFQLENWMEQHEKTVAATDESAWREICNEIAATGFPAVEIWEAHASPDSLDRKKALVWKQILEDHGLKPIAYAGRLRRETLQMCRWLQIPHLDGSLGGLNPDEATKLCEGMEVPFNLENHPEKSAGEILAKIDGGNEWLGVCLDTGWLATQSAPVPETILAIGDFVRHNHIKDVTEHGAHETCLLGEGVAQLEVCMEPFHRVGYEGWYSWEDEPEDRNPFDSAVRNREWIENHIL